MLRPQTIRLEITLQDHGHVYVYEIVNNESHRILTSVTFPKEAGWRDGIQSFCNWAAAGLEQELKPIVDKWVNSKPDKTVTLLGARGLMLALNGIRFDHAKPENMHYCCYSTSV